MERLAVLSFGVHECDERVDDVVDRDDVGSPGVRQQHRGEPGQHGQPREHAEEVVRPVDLVHLAGAGVAHHHRRAVDAVPQPGSGAHQQLSFELRLVIRRRQPLADVEVVLGVLTGEVAGHGDRGHVVKCGVQPPRQFDDGPGAIDIGGSLLGIISGDVVDRRTVHHMVDPTQLGDGLVGQFELRQVTDQWLCSVIPLQGQMFEATQRLTANQHPHLRVGLRFQ